MPAIVKPRARALHCPSTALSASDRIDPNHDEPWRGAPGCRWCSGWRDSANCACIARHVTSPTRVRSRSRDPAVGWVVQPIVADIRHWGKGRRLPKSATDSLPLAATACGEEHGQASQWRSPLVAPPDRHAASRFRRPDRAQARALSRARSYGEPATLQGRGPQRSRGGLCRCDGKSDQPHG